MSLVGNLEDLGLGDILQIVSLSRKSGVLFINNNGKEGKLIFRDGQVVRGFSTDVQEDVETSILESGVVDKGQLSEAMKAFEESGGNEGLDEIIISKFGVNQDAFDEIKKRQIEKSSYSLFGWASGNFNFELKEVDDHMVKSDFFVYAHGMNPQFIAMEGTRLQDEMKRDGIDQASQPDVAPDGDVQLEPEPITEQQSGTETTHAPESEPDPNLQQDSASQPVIESGQDDGGHDLYAEFEEFERQQQEEQSKKEAIAGPVTAEAMGGEIKHLHEETAADNEPPKAEPETSSVSMKDVKKGVIIIDDDKGTLGVLKDALSEKGFDAIAVDKTESALHIVSELYSLNASMVVISDLIMPRMDGTGILGGIETLEILRGGFPEIPVILMTDHVNRDAEKRALEMGVHTYLDKPKKSQFGSEYDATAVDAFLNNISGILNQLFDKGQEDKPAEIKPDEDKRGESKPPENKSAEGGGLFDLGADLKEEVAAMGEILPEEDASPRPHSSPGISMLKSMMLIAVSIKNRVE